MAGPNTHRVGHGMGDWMRDMEKRVLHEERRPLIREASDLMGPGLAPTAVEITDWNAEETQFNGFFYSNPGALHTPDGTKMWIGMTISTRTGHGLQKVWSHGDTAVLTYVRLWHAHDETPIPIYTPWTAD